jgi:hypothetical protein
MESAYTVFIELKCPGARRRQLLSRDQVSTFVIGEDLRLTAIQRRLLLALFCLRLLAGLCFAMISGKTVGQAAPPLTEAP